MNQIIIVSLLATLTVISLYLIRQISLSKRTLQKSETARISLEEQFSFKPDLSKPTELPSMRLIVEIQNPIAVAHREQPMTKYISELAPELIMQKVYKQVAGEIASGLKEKDVDARINIVVR